MAVVGTGNAGSQTTKGPEPFLTVDAWRHAHDLSYQNRGTDHVPTVIGKLLSWEFATGPARVRKRSGRSATVTGLLQDPGMVLQ